MDTGNLADSTTAEVADAIDQLHALTVVAHSQLLGLVADYDRREAWREDGATSMADWLVARLGLAHGNAREWVRVARSLEDLPAIARVFSDGRLSFDQLAPLTALAGPDTDAAMAEQAPGYGAAQLEAAARRSRSVPTEEANESHRRRSLTMRWDPQGRFLRLRGRLADAEGAVVERAISVLAEAAPPDPATGVYEDFGSRCADALTELASLRLAAEADADRASVVVHAEASVLGGAEGGAEIDGDVLIAPETARRLACDSTWQLVAEGPDGQALGLGRRRRQVPRWLSRQLRRRDGGCRFPGCGRTRWLHAHHLRHWAQGGPTDPANLVMVCGYHHRLIHEGGWSTTGDPREDLSFLRPGGRPLTTRPPPLRSEVEERMAV